MRLHKFLIALALLSVTFSARADSFLYTVTTTGTLAPEFNGTSSFTEPSKLIRMFWGEMSRWTTRSGRPWSSVLVWA